MNSLSILLEALSDPREVLYVKSGGELGGPGDTNLSGIIPSVAPGNFGSKSFRKEFNLKYAYVGGAMVGGISSVNMVSALAEMGVLGIFGATGLSPEVVEENIVTLKKSLGLASFGSCLIHTPQDPQWEERVTQIYLDHKINLVEASAFLQITPSLVRYRLTGITTLPDGSILVPNRIMAKVSRLELARRFFSPPPEKLVREALSRNWITEEEAKLAPFIPMAQDITAEADSGGHTDFRPAICLWPAMINLAAEYTQKYDYYQPLRVGAAGGLGTPYAILVAQNLGAAYFVTGSINQSCVESGLSEEARALLAKASQADISQAPAADMFELGAKVQVLKYGTLYAMRAQKLSDLYRFYNSVDNLPEEEKNFLEEKIFRKSIAETWEDTLNFFKTKDPAQAERALSDPKYKMALIFRWYLGQASRWAINGLEDRRTDWGIFCGPAQGAFNEWALGSLYENPKERNVTALARNLLFGAAVLKRFSMARDLGLIPDDLPPELNPLTPEELADFL